VRGIIVTEDKALIKKDMVLILKLDSKLNYKDIGEVKQIHATAVNRKLFSTSEGQRYLNKLNHIINGVGKEGCLFCGGTTNSDSVVCASCLNRLKGMSTNSAPKKPTESNVNKEMQATTFTQNVGSTAQEISQTTDHQKDTFASDPSKEQPSHSGTTAQTNSNTTPIKNKTWKLVGLGVAVIILLIVVASVGLGNIFAFATTIALCVLIYRVVKKLPKRNTIIVLFFLAVLTGIFYKEPNQNDMDSLMGMDNKEVGTVQGNASEYFDLSKRELMLEIQKKLDKYDLDIATKEGYPNFYFVLSDDEATGVIYQVAADDNEKVYSVFVNNTNSTDNVEFFANAFISAVLVCDPKITDTEMKKMLDSVQESKKITINNITYNGGVLKDNVLSYWFTMKSAKDN
jgi:hypothetical protein